MTALLYSNHLTSTIVLTMMALHWVRAGVKVLWGQVHRVGEAGHRTGLLGVVVVHLLHLDSVVLCLRPQVCPGNRQGRSNVIRTRRSEVFGAEHLSGQERQVAPRARKQPMLRMKGVWFLAQVEMKMDWLGPMSGMSQESQVLAVEYIMVESYCHADPPDLHVPVAVLLHQLVSEVVEGCPGLLVRRLHLLLQAHPHDAVALAINRAVNNPS